MDTVFNVAKLDDVADIVEAARDAAKLHDAEKMFVFSDAIAYNTIKFLVTQPTSIVIIERTGVAVTGVIGLIVAPHYFSTAIVASKLFWFSNSKRTAVKLLHLGRNWAKSKGATKFTVSTPCRGKRFGVMKSVDMSFLEDI